MRINTPESTEQILIVNWVRQCTDIPCIHIVNEGKRSQQQGSMLKRMGMTSGVSDLFFPRATPEFHGLWIEVKAMNGKVSPAQQKFIDNMIQEGFFAIAAWGADAAIEIIKTHYHLR